MEKTITFTEEDLELNYTSPCGCSIFTAMKRVRIPVYSVGPENWTFRKKDGRVGRRVEFSTGLLRASTVLAAACGSKDKKKLAQRDTLAGKSFKVTY